MLNIIRRAFFKIFIPMYVCDVGSEPPQRSKEVATSGVALKLKPAQETKQCARAVCKN